MTVELPKTNFFPPFNITRASHLVFAARDLAASRDFYTEVIGLIVTDETPDTLWLRGVEERCHHSLTLKRTNGQPMCERIGMRVFMDEDLDKAKAHFDKIGIGSKFADVPHQGRTLHFNDPAGTPIELCATMPVVPLRWCGGIRRRGDRPVSPSVSRSRQPRAWPATRGLGTA